MIIPDVQVGLNMTSVEKDLKIKFVNRKTGKLIPHVVSRWRSRDRIKHITKMMIIRTELFI